MLRFYDHTASSRSKVQYHLTNSKMLSLHSSIPYTAIHRAQPLRRIFQMSYVTGEGHEATLHVKMATSGQAAALYRAVTEKHAFFCCETVRRDVTEQFIRDLKVRYFNFLSFSS